MVIETTVTLDPVKDAEIVKALLEKPEWKIKKQLTTAITFHYFWHGDLVDMPLYGLKQEGPTIVPAEGGTDDGN